MSCNVSVVDVIVEIVDIACELHCVENFSVVVVVIVASVVVLVVVVVIWILRRLLGVVGVWVD